MASPTPVVDYLISPTRDCQQITWRSPSVGASLIGRPREFWMPAGIYNERHTVVLFIGVRYFLLQLPVSIFHIVNRHFICYAFPIDGI